MLPLFSEIFKIERKVRSVLALMLLLFLFNLANLAVYPA